jgi:hypothetical protein
LYTVLHLIKKGCVPLKFNNSPREHNPNQHSFLLKPVTVTTHGVVEASSLAWAITLFVIKLGSITVNIANTNGE